MAWVSDDSKRLGKLVAATERIATALETLAAQPTHAVVATWAPADVARGEAGTAERRALEEAAAARHEEWQATQRRACDVTAAVAVALGRLADAAERKR